MIIGDNRSSVVFTGFDWPKLRGENAWYFLDFDNDSKALSTITAHPIISNWAPPLFFLLHRGVMERQLGSVYKRDFCLLTAKELEFFSIQWRHCWIDDLVRIGASCGFSQGQFLFIEMRRNVILGESTCPALTDCLMVMVCRRVPRCRSGRSVVLCTVLCTPLCRPSNYYTHNMK